MTTADFDDASDFPTLAEMSDRRRKDLLFNCARDLFMWSIPKGGGEPALSPERAFTLAAEFIDEAERRGL